MFTKSVIVTSMLLGLGLLMSSSVEAGGSYQKQNWGVSPQAHLYGGGSLGLSNQGAFDDGLTVGGKVYGGMKFNRMLGAEVGYMHIGEAEGESKDTPDGRLKADLTSDMDAIYAAAVGYLPVAPHMDLIGKAGVARWSQDSSKDVKEIAEKSSTTDDGISPLIGVGAQYRVSPNMHIRGEWEHAFNAGTKDTAFETGIDLMSVGVTFSTF
ncbi:outer membrane beta-barrel protein [uncultured Thiothrix sp.]|mgnify:CR=1 FL=1|uniref:outer membrane beta-barrel protein n=1 Tax=uncultured Thiothrix sp. TaxID=223185 RepID=UPI002632A98A|nr:outer membrane beta-barrel protein [uncultured Thiothrix sp.]